MCILYDFIIQSFPSVIAPDLCSLFGFFFFFVVFIVLIGIGNFFPLCLVQHTHTHRNRSRGHHHHRCPEIRLARHVHVRFPHCTNRFFPSKFANHITYDHCSMINRHKFLNPGKRCVLQLNDR